MAGNEPGGAGSIAGAPGPAAGAPGAPDAPPAAEAAAARGGPEARAGDPRGDPRPAEAAALVEALRVAVLQRMTEMMAALPGGYYTEIKGQLAEGMGGALVGTFKLRDFCAALKDVAAIGRGLGGPDVEDLSPIMGMVYGDGSGDDDDEGDGED